MKSDEIHSQFDDYQQGKSHSVDNLFLEKRLSGFDQQADQQNPKSQETINNIPLRACQIFHTAIFGVVNLTQHNA